MHARALLLSIFTAVLLVALAGSSWAGTGRRMSHPWTGTGNHHGRQNQNSWQRNGNRDGGWNQPDRADWNGHSNHEKWLNQRDHDRWQGTPPHGSWNDDRDDHDRTERFQPPWGGPLYEGGHPPGAAL